MDAPTAVPTDPVALIRHLDADAIRSRLAQMEAERQALLVLLRAARAAKSAHRREVPSGAR
jgi:hypothetical protein